MSEPTVALLARLKGRQASSLLPRLRSLLKSADGRVLPPPGALSTASVLEPIWRVRLQLSEANGNRIDGLDELLPRLQALPLNQPVQQFGVVGSDEAGNVFFDAESGELLGAVLVTMSEHTRAFFRGGLKSKPFGPRAGTGNPAKVTAHRPAKGKRVPA